MNYIEIKQQEIYFEMVSGNCLVDCAWPVKRNPLSSCIFVTCELRSKRQPPKLSRAIAIKCSSMFIELIELVSVSFFVTEKVFLKSVMGPLRD